MWDRCDNSGNEQQRSANTHRSHRRLVISSCKRNRQRQEQQQQETSNKPDKREPKTRVLSDIRRVERRRRGFRTRQSTQRLIAATNHRSNANSASRSSELVFIEFNGFKQIRKHLSDRDQTGREEELRLA